MTTRLKICGITRLEDARYAAAAGADYLGFVQHPGSPRYIEPKQVRDIVEWIHGPQPVGVFVNAPVDVVNRTAEQAGFDLVQLHGEEPVSDILRIERPVIKAFRIAPDTTPEALSRTMRAYAHAAACFLLDAYSEHVYGGSGQTFDWRIAKPEANPPAPPEADPPDRPERPGVFLAGGIHAGNVAEAIRTLRPFAVDVSSGLESAPGHKDFSRIDAFMDAFREAQDPPQNEPQRPPHTTPTEPYA